ncbi:MULTISPECIES: hypothetical protein [Pseudomonas]|uniref:hypothetical protein n=1 Tax=Pseudomonas TaxID=286 RepID=UPI000BA36325|nr:MULTISPECIES: hypothetical protein [Pseudomonas]MCU1722583.1 hypothetical protein [Pseudomonas sp. 5P_5.1_Bac1]MCU1734285.1 hypothetical protein [Pseudomonas sp. 20P_3.2_Bac4]MCU1746148.1 hypothetical protein [Pseudomonas sp. 20P_3.2_Bac5]
MRATILPLLLFLSLPAVAAPMHGQFLPPDEQSVRGENPESQQLLQVTSYSVVVGNQRQSNQQPLPITSSLTMRLKGKPLSQGATITQVVISFDGEGKSLKKPAFDSATRTLTLNYAPAQYQVILDLLRNDTVYVQFLSYPNGHIWADLHTGTLRAR